MDWSMKGLFIMEIIFLNLLYTGIIFCFTTSFLIIPEIIFILNLIYRRKYFPNLLLWWKLFIRVRLINKFNEKYFTNTSSGSSVFFQQSAGRYTNFQTGKSREVAKNSSPCLYTKFYRQPGNNNQIQQSWKLYNP